MSRSKCIKQHRQDPGQQRGDIDKSYQKSTFNAAATAQGTT
jgi:hypothetical protein